MIDVTHPSRKDDDRDNVFLFGQIISMGIRWHHSAVHRLTVLALTVVGLGFVRCAAAASDGHAAAPTSIPAPVKPAEDSDEQNDLTEAITRIRELEAIVAGMQAESLNGPAPATFDVMPSPYQPLPDQSTHDGIYDSGWTWRPRNPQESPFELTIGLHNQFRYTGFSRDEATSVDAAGNIREINNRNDFNINRGRLVFSGYAFHEDLQFYSNIDYSTVTSNPIQLLLGWISFRMSDRLSIYLGLGKLPGTWEWTETSRYTLGADRTMATTFFRPSITAGMWAKGKLTDDIFYHALVGNGYNTLSLQASELDTQLAYSALSWWEPLEEFGPGFSDIADHQSLAIRLGHGLTQTRNASSSNADPAAEQTVIRLSDGTRLIEPNAIAPGVTVNAFDIWLYSAHFGIKRRGFSFSSEVFLRWLRNIEGDTGTMLPSQFDQGFYVQSGVFVIPQTLELFARGSQVNGEYGSGDEISAGFNWYLFNKRSARFTFDVTSIDDSSAQQSRTGYVAGESGSLFRSQLWTFF
ncbi:MAG: porin [Rhodopirellula sp. JB055]|uniref:porin n=1 Tax=Rhodopirellula sp. JB055 TaxID=3342846 RepID=UPI00370B50D1